MNYDIIAYSSITDRTIHWFESHPNPPIFHELTDAFYAARLCTKPVALSTPPYAIFHAIYSRLCLPRNLLCTGNQRPPKIKSFFLTHDRLLDLCKHNFVY